MNVERLIERLTAIPQVVTLCGAKTFKMGERITAIEGRDYEAIAEAAAALAKLQAERDEAREALRRLNERKAMYDRSSRNQADAYYNLVKGADADWLAASRAMGGGE